jgi:hypothetical protein
MKPEAERVRDEHGPGMTIGGMDREKKTQPRGWVCMVPNSIMISNAAPVQYSPSSS